MHDYKVLFYFLESNFCYFFTYKLSEFSLFFDILMSTNIPQYILYIIEHHSPTMRSLQIFRQYYIFFDHAHYYNKLLVQ